MDCTVLYWEATAATQNVAAGADVDGATLLAAARDLSGLQHGRARCAAPPRRCRALGVRGRGTGAVVRPPQPRCSRCPTTKAAAARALMYSLARARGAMAAFFKWLSTKYPKIVVDCIEERPA